MHKSADIRAMLWQPKNDIYRRKRRKSRKTPDAFTEKQEAEAQE